MSPQLAQFLRNSLQSPSLSKVGLCPFVSLLWVGKQKDPGTGFKTRCSLQKRLKGCHPAHYQAPKNTQDLVRGLQEGVPASGQGRICLTSQSGPSGQLVEKRKSMKLFGCCFVQPYQPRAIEALCLERRAKSCPKLWLLLWVIKVSKP